MQRHPIAGVVFDVGHVLVSVRYDTIAENLGRHSPLTPDEIQNLLVGGDLENESETGRYDSREYFRRVKERIDGASDWSYDQFAEEFSTGLVMTEVGVAALRYAAKRARVFLMSNTNYLHARWMYGQEVLATLPEQHFFSFREGIMKPDPRLWETFFARTGLEAKQCLFVDDRSENCEAAAKIGVRALQYDASKDDLVGMLKEHLRE